MKLTRIIIIVLVIVVIVVAGLFALSALQPSGPACTTTWNCAAPYQIQVAGNYGVAAESCVGNSTYVYCVGGIDPNGGPRNDVYVGAISSSGNITSWTLSSNNYPMDINAQSCVTSSGYLYCVGGSYDDAGDDVASTYYAQLSGGSVGTWFSSTAYPIPTDSQSCVASAGYIYCVAGNNETAGSNSNVVPSNSAWYAPLSQLGIGNWTKTTTYPANALFPSCAAANGYVYCVAGSDDNGDAIGTVYYAALSSSGIGPWSQATAYPLPSTGPACGISAGEIYCVGGETVAGQTPSYTNAVYYAPISSSGIGGWNEAPDYPINVGTSCAVTSGHIYCVGGFDESTAGLNNDVKYASLASLAA